MEKFTPSLGDYLVFKSDRLMAFWDQRESLTFFHIESASKVGSEVIAESFPDRLDPLDSSTEEWELASIEAYRVALSWSENYQHPDDSTCDTRQSAKSSRSILGALGSLFTSKGSKIEELPFLGQAETSAAVGDFVVDVSDDEFVVWNTNNPDRFRSFRVENFSHNFNFGESQGWDPQYFLIASEYAQNWRKHIQELIAKDLADSDS